MGGGVGGGVGSMVQIAFLVSVLRQEGTRRVRMGEFPHTEGSPYIHPQP